MTLKQLQRATKKLEKIEADIVAQWVFWVSYEQTEGGVSTLLTKLESARTAIHTAFMMLRK